MPIEVIPVVDVFAPTSTEKGEATAQKEVGKGNGNWNAGAYVWNYDTVEQKTSLIFSTAIEEIYIREHLQFVEIPIKVGIYDLSKNTTLSDRTKPSVGYGCLLYDGDVLGAYYRCDSTVQNTISIEKVDTLAKEMSGIFDVHFKSTDLSYSRAGGYPDNVNFAKGKFTVKLPK